MKPEDVDEVAALHATVGCLSCLTDCYHFRSLPASVDHLKVGQLDNFKGIFSAILTLKQVSVSYNADPPSVSSETAVDEVPTAAVSWRIERLI
jgi:hypothetical protein